MKFENNGQIPFGYAENGPVSAKTQMSKAGDLQDKTIFVWDYDSVGIFAWEKGILLPYGAQTPVRPYLSRPDGSFLFPENYPICQKRLFRGVDNVLPFGPQGRVGEDGGEFIQWDDTAHHGGDVDAAGVDEVQEIGRAHV